MNIVKEIFKYITNFSFYSSKKLIIINGDWGLGIGD